MGEAARRRIREGGPVAKGREALSLGGLAKLRALVVIGRAGQRCEACGRRRLALELEHALPRGRGGADTWGNCWAACGGPVGCHRWKESSYGGTLGRLLVEPIGDGRFTFRVATGTKAEPVILTTWTGGRIATTEEAARLAGLR